MSDSDSTPKDSVTDQAAYWWARLRSPDCAGDEHAAFAAWLTEDPAHRRAYDAAEFLWNDLGKLIPASHPLRHEACTFLESQRKKATEKGVRTEKGERKKGSAEKGVRPEWR